MNQRLRRGWLAIGVLLLLGTSAAAYFYFVRPITSQTPVTTATSREETVATPEQIQTYCSKCHAYPPPESFPRHAWQGEVAKAYQIIADAQLYRKNLDLKAPPRMDQVIHYYEERAPLALPEVDIQRATGPLPLRLERREFPVVPESPNPAIAGLSLVHLSDERRLDVLACDMRAGLVMVLRPYASSPSWEIVGRVPNPCHAEVVDLDGDGVKDILVANLGSMQPADHSNGSVVWLRGRREGGFTPITLLKDVGRVADVQAADFRGKGVRDLVVAEFGLFRTGRVLYLENRTKDWSRPEFELHVMDDRPGAIHVPVADLDGDGRLDFVALISQDQETIIAFLNQGNGEFRKETIYTAPHPAWGSSGIQLVDLNGDKRLDVLFSNGDTMDPPFLLKPYHGISWLENPGHFPFIHHPIAPMYGVHRAVAADFRGKGLLDILAVSYLPPHAFPQRKGLKLGGVVYLEQTSPGQFARHTLEAITCDHAACAAGDIFGTGRADLVTGNFVEDPAANALTIWRNQGAK